MKLKFQSGDIRFSMDFKGGTLNQLIPLAKKWRTFLLIPKKGCKGLIENLIG